MPAVGNQATRPRGPAAACDDGALMDTAHSPWRTPLIWRAAQLLARALVGLLARLEVTGDVAAHLRRGPLVLAANHISPFDPVVMAAACQTRGIAPGSWRPPGCSAPR